MNERTHVVVAIGIVGLAMAVAGCGSSSRSGSSAAGSADTFVLSEFTVIPPTNTLHAGSVSITANNVGGEVHELVIVRAAAVSALPMKSDGSVDEAKIAAADKVGEITDVAARSKKTKAFDFKAGSYVALCNLVDSMMGSGSDTSHDAGMGSAMGHVHFSEGMVVSFTVS